MPWLSGVMLCCFFLLSGCAGRSTPAPVTTLELRKQQLQQQETQLTSRRYIVQRGDTLYSIAFRSGQDFRTLAARNNIRAPYTIYPGQVLQLQNTAVNAATSQSVTTASSPSRRVSTPVVGERTTNTTPAKSVAAAGQNGYGQEVTRGQSQGNASPAITGRIHWQWPVRGQILARFSSAEQGNKGVDIGGREGTRINAAADGQVVYAGNALRGYGNLIIIKHNDDYLSAYAHNRRILVKERQDVKAGQQIAEMGDTDASSSRLHFEIRFRGQSVDPLRYLPQ